MRLSKVRAKGQIMWYILDENDQPIPKDVLAASIWMAENREKRVVEHDSLPDGSVLSTVFLCLDHSMERSDKPVLYESMWFGGPHDGRQRRYKTRQEAIEGHAEMLGSYGEYFEFALQKLAEM